MGLGSGCEAKAVRAVGGDEPRDVTQQEAQHLVRVRVRARARVRARVPRDVTQ